MTDTCFLKKDGMLVTLESYNKKSTLESYNKKSILDEFYSSVFPFFNFFLLIFGRVVFYFIYSLTIFIISLFVMTPVTTPFSITRTAGLRSRM